MDRAHALTVAVFVATYAGMAFGRVPGLKLDRTGIALMAVATLLAFGVTDVAAIGRAVDAPTLLLLFALMLLSAQFAGAGFYDACATGITGARASPTALLGLTVLVSGALSAVLANDIVVYAMTPLLCAGLKRRRLDPRPFLVGLAGGSNAGSAATIIGNPQNILIGQVGGLDFWDFAAVCGIPALVALFFTPIPREIGALAIAALLLASRTMASRAMIGAVDWHLLLLFACLFTVTAAFADTGFAADGLAWLKAHALMPDNIAVLAPLALVLSNGIGNVPAVILLMAVWTDAAPGALYGLALLSTLAGNFLIVGSLANLIVAERAAVAGVRLSFRDFARAGVPMTLLSMAFAVLWLALGGWMPWR